MAVAVMAYFDGSGKVESGDRFITVAGYAGTPAAWSAFEACWTSVLHRHGCAQLHMKDANALRGSFMVAKGWSAAKVTSLLDDLVDECLSQIGRTTFAGEFLGTACSVDLEDYSNMGYDYPEILLVEPEAICTNFVVDKSMQLLAGIDDRIELYFDRGEKFLAKIDRLYRQTSVKKREFPHTLIDRVVAGNSRMVGIQAADFLAWHLNRHLTTEADFPSYLRRLPIPECGLFDAAQIVRSYAFSQNGGQGLWLPPSAFAV